MATRYYVTVILIIIISSSSGGGSGNVFNQLRSLAHCAPVQ